MQLHSRTQMYDDYDVLNTDTNIIYNESK